MDQCILNAPLWHDGSRVKYSQVHRYPVLKTFSFESLSWVSATRFAELIQIRQYPKCMRPKTF